MSQLFSGRICKKITNCSNIAKVKMYGSADMTDMSIHLHMVIKHHPKALTRGRRKNNFLTRKLAENPALGEVIIKKLCLIIINFELFTSHP